MTIFMVISLLLALLQPQDLNLAIDRLAAPRAGLREVNALASDFDDSEVIDALINRLAHDPAFARGTRGANNAICVLAATHDDSGGIRISRADQAAILADSLSWADTSTKLTVLRIIARVDEPLRATVAPQVGAVLMTNDAGLVYQALQSISHGNLPLTEATRARIRRLALRDEADESLWADARAWDDRLLAGAKMQTGLQMGAIAAYLTTGDPASGWREISSAQACRNRSGLHGCALAAALLAERGALNEALEKLTFDAIITIARDPASDSLSEPSYVWALLGALDERTAGHDALARGMARLVAETESLSKPLRAIVTAALDRYGSRTP
jgi:hypothetical protein